MIAEDFQTETSSFPATSYSRDSLLLSTASDYTPCSNCQASLLQAKFAQLESKIDTIFSLASTLNSKHLEHNSQALFNLSSSSADCLDSMKNSRCINLVVRLIYEEWTELFEFFTFYTKSCLDKSALSLLSDKVCLLEVLNRRLLSRELANQTLANLVDDTRASKKLRIYELIKKLNAFSQSFFSFLISRIDSQTLDSVAINDHVLVATTGLFSNDTLQSLNESLGELVKRSFDEEQRFYLGKLGG